jgi:hypothetical protein
MRASQPANSSSPQMALSIEVRASRQSKLGATLAAVGLMELPWEGLVPLLMQSARSEGFGMEAQGRMFMGCAPLGEAVIAPTIKHAEKNAERIAPNYYLPTKFILDCSSKSRTSRVSLPDVPKLCKPGIAGIPKCHSSAQRSVTKAGVHGREQIRLIPSDLH